MLIKPFLRYSKKYEKWHINYPDQSCYLMYWIRQNSSVFVNCYLSLLVFNYSQLEIIHLENSIQYTLNHITCLCFVKVISADTHTVFVYWDVVVLGCSCQFQFADTLLFICTPININNCLLQTNRKLECFTSCEP